MNIESFNIDSSTPKDRGYFMYEEAGKLIGVTATTIANYTREHNLKYGTITLDGRARGVVEYSSFMNFIRNRNNLTPVWG